MKRILYIVSSVISDPVAQIQLLKSVGYYTMGTILSASLTIMILIYSTVYIYIYIYIRGGGKSAPCNGAGGYIAILPPIKRENKGFRVH